MATPAEIEAILNGPALLAPPGVPYQFENPPNTNSLCFGILGVFLVLAVLACCMRIYTKWMILHSLAAEDYFLLVGTAFYIGYTGVAVKLVFAGAGTHQWDIQVKNIEQVLYLIYVEEIVYAFGINLIRISILLQYLRIFQQFSRASFMYIGCWTTLWLIVVFNTITDLLIIFACSPRSKFWDPLILTGHCLNSDRVVIATGSFNFISDVVLLLLPQYEIWKLHMSSRRKAAVSGIFLIALAACVTSVMRLVYSIKVQQTGDISYNIAFLGMTSVAEVSIGTVCCCLPVFPRYFQQIIAPKIQYLASSSFWLRTRSKSSEISKSIRKRSTREGKSVTTQTGSKGLPIQGMYSTLDGTELQGLQTKGSDVASRTGNSDEHGLQDEMGGIRMTHEVVIEDSPAQGEDLDVEAQLRAVSTRTDW